MKRADVVRAIEASRIIVILRRGCLSFVEQQLPILVELGLRIVEVSSTADDYTKCLESIVKQYGKRLVIGAGTILTSDQFRHAIDHGAEFLISPHFDRKLAEEILKEDRAYIPGCLTPTEVVDADRTGVDAVKIFPASVGGVGYIKALRAPFPKLRLVPTGGVTPAEAPAYFAAGAWALGIGSSITALARDPHAQSELKQLFSH